MKIQELAEAAGNQVNNERDFLALEMPQRQNQHRGSYLSGRNSPKGESMGGNGKIEIVHFNPIDVLAFCVVYGAEIDIVFENNG